MTPAEIAELERLRDRKELMQLREKKAAAVTKQQYQTPQGPLREAGKWALGRVGEAAEFVDRYTGAPIREAIYEAQKPGDRDVFGAFTGGFGKEDAVRGKEIAERAGLSGEQTIKSPLILNPFDEKQNKLSPAGIVGAGLETMTDPLAYIPLPGTAAAKTGARALGTAGSEKVAAYLKDVARMRALKSATGQSKKAISKLARAHKDDPNIMRQMENLNTTGDILLEKGKDGRIVRPFSSVEAVGTRAADKLEKAKAVYGDISETVTDAYPEGIARVADVADNVEQYARTLRSTGKSGTARNMVLQEVDKIKARAGEMGETMSFDDLIELKADYPYDPQSPDLLLTNKDAVNAINEIIDDHIDNAVVRTVNHPDPEIRAAVEGRNLRENFADVKKRYGIYKNLAQAAADRRKGDIANRVVSPSDQFWGAETGRAKAINKGGYTPADILLTIGSVGFHKFVRGRGSSALAVAADKLSNLIGSNAERFGKWSSNLMAAAGKSPGLMIYNHSLLMQEDPEYRKAVQEGLTNVQTEPYKTAGDAIDAVGMGQLAFAGVAIPMMLVKMLKSGRIGQAANALRQANQANPEDLAKAGPIFKRLVKEHDPDNADMAGRLWDDSLKGQKFSGDVGDVDPEIIKGMKSRLDEANAPVPDNVRGIAEGIRSNADKSLKAMSMVEDATKGGVKRLGKTNEIMDQASLEFSESDTFAELLSRGNKSAQSKGMFGHTHREYLDAMDDFIDSELTAPDNIKNLLKKETADTRDRHIKNKSIDDEI